MPTVRVIILIGRSRHSCCSFFRWFSLRFSTFASESHCVAPQSPPLATTTTSSSSSSSWSPRQRRHRRRRRQQVPPPSAPDESPAWRQHASPSRANPSSRCSVSVRYFFGGCLNAAVLRNVLLDARKYTANRPRRTTACQYHHRRHKYNKKTAHNSSKCCISRSFKTAQIKINAKS